MENSAVGHLRIRGRPVVETTVERTEGLAGLVPPSLPHRRGIVPDDARPGLLEREVRVVHRTIEGSEGPSLAHRIFIEIQRKLRPGTPPPAPRDEPNAEAKIAEAKANIAYTNRVLARRWEWEGRSDHPWAQVIRGGPEERHRR